MRITNNQFDREEFIRLCKVFGQSAFEREIEVRYAGNDYFNMVRKSVSTDRRGEVVFCVIRPSGKYITITCEEYPEGIYRIPTGGIGHSEDILEAVKRETIEELGLETEILHFAGVLKIKLVHDDQHVMFYSYIFIMKEKGGRLLLDATDNEVSEVREVDLQGLKETAEALKSIKSRWKDWGAFRYETTNAVYQFLRDIEDKGKNK